MRFSVRSIRHLYDFRSHYLDRNGQRLHYLDEGDGHPVVMLHGNPSWSFMYRELARALRESCRVIVPDHMGCGLSDKPGDEQYNYTLAERIRDLEALLEHLDVRGSITLVMHDWGGPIGMGYAVRHPLTINRLVVLNTAAFLLPGDKNLPWSLRFCRNSALAAVLIRGLNLFSVAAARLGCRRQKMAPDVRRAYTGPYRSWKNSIATLRFVQDIPLEPGDRSYSLLRQIEQNLDRFQGRPILICWGDKDFVFDQDILQEWIRRFPSAEVHRFSDAGHCILEDVPERVIPLVAQFVTKDRLSGGSSE